jgi:hypothetical protein
MGLRTHAGLHHRAAHAEGPAPLIIDEFVAESMGIRQFAREVVAPLLRTKYAGFSIADVVGDPAGRCACRQTSGRAFRSWRRRASPPKPPTRTTSFPRREAVAFFLTGLAGGEPAFLISPSCTTLRRGFNGKYRYERLRVAGERYQGPSRRRTTTRTRTTPFNTFACGSAAGAFAQHTRAVCPERERRGWT